MIEDVCRFVAAVTHSKSDTAFETHCHGHSCSAKHALCKSWQTHARIDNKIYPSFASMHLETSYVTSLPRASSQQQWQNSRQSMWHAPTSRRITVQPPLEQLLAHPLGDSGLLGRGWLQVGPQPAHPHWWRGEGMASLTWP